jgi:hypothetical protein
VPYSLLFSFISNSISTFLWFEMSAHIYPFSIFQILLINLSTIVSTSNLSLWILFLSLYFSVKMSLLSFWLGLGGDGDKYASLFAMFHQCSTLSWTPGQVCCRPGATVRKYVIGVSKNFLYDKLVDSWMMPQCLSYSKSLNMWEPEVLDSLTLNFLPTRHSELQGHILMN